MFGPVISAVRIALHQHNQQDNGNSVESDSGVDEEDEPVGAHARSGRQKNFRKHGASRHTSVAEREGMNDNEDHRHNNVASHDYDSLSSYARVDRVESLESRLDMVERNLQKFAGQPAKEMCRPSAHVCSIPGKVKVEGPEAFFGRTYPTKISPQRQSTASKARIHRVAVTLARAKAKGGSESSKKPCRRRKSDDLRINGTPKLDLHRGGKTSRYKSVSSPRHNLRYSLRGDRARQSL